MVELDNLAVKEKACNQLLTTGDSPANPLLSMQVSRHMQPRVRE
jgi:hypothetical protein